VRAERFDPAPDHLAGGAERVEIGRAVAGDARGQDLVLQGRGRQRRALQLFED